MSQQLALVENVLKKANDDLWREGETQAFEDRNGISKAIIHSERRGWWERLGRGMDVL